MPPQSLRGGPRTLDPLSAGSMLDPALGMPFPLLPHLPFIFLSSFFILFFGDDDYDDDDDGDGDDLNDDEIEQNIC